VAVLLVGNNLLAFFYLSRIEFTRSAYGSLSMPLILLFGLYVFWLFILVGGQISYAVQNVHFRNSQAAWTNLTAATRERLTLAVLLTICRNFQNCRPPSSTAQLGGTIKVPTQILNEALNRLVDLGLISMVPPGPTGAAAGFLYQPARPLNRLTLGQFKSAFENYGENPAGDTLARVDPIVSHYLAAMEEGNRHELLTKSLDQLFMEHPFEQGPQPPVPA
jgi:membrane protein